MIAGSAMMTVGVYLISRMHSLPALYGGIRSSTDVHTGPCWCPVIAYVSGKNQFAESRHNTRILFSAFDVEFRFADCSWASWLKYWGIEILLKYMTLFPFISVGLFFQLFKSETPPGKSLAVRYISSALKSGGFVNDHLIVMPVTKN